MSKSWNFNPKQRQGQDGVPAFKRKRPQKVVSKSEQRRQERALKIGDIKAFDDLADVDETDL